ncbi:hypothetical protein [Micromonospora fulviviridis]|uniref:hypothetical protein n=1 Tax=Micromonospora fulviviridis TaxID=47860 RepID=UPI003795B43D
MATGNAVLVIVYHLLSDPAARFRDLGADYFDTRIDKQRRARNLAIQLQAVTGQRITIRDGKAIIAEPRSRLTQPPKPGSTALRRVLPPAHSPLDFRV